MAMTYEERLAALGITKRGMLESGFESPGTISTYQEPEYINRPASKRIQKPFEDLSWMNPHSSKNRSKEIKRWWKSLSTEEKKKRKKILAEAAMKGAKAKKRVHFR